MKDFQQEQLFTELTPEQASVIEGGGVVTVKSIECVTAGADWPSSVNDDDTYIQISDQTIWGPNSMDDGLSANVSTSKAFKGSTKISVYDNDPVSSDFIGSIDVSGPTRDKKGKPAYITKSVEGSGSKYNVTFKVT